MMRPPVWPTARGWAMLCAAFLSLLNAMVNPNLASFVFCAGCCSIVLASFFFSVFSLRKISLKREIGRDAMRNNPVLLPLEITNGGALSRQTVLIREVEKITGQPLFDTVVDPLLPGERRLVQRSPIAKRRGRFQLKYVRLLGGDPAGLFRRTKRFDLPEEVIIRPDRERITWMPIKIHGRLQGSPTGRNAGASGFGQDFFGVREHRLSDGVRFINWKASARHGHLMVKEFEEQDIPLVSILLDCSKRSVGINKLDSNFEMLVKIAASIADYLGGLYCRMAFISGPLAQGAPPIIETGLSFSMRKGLSELLTDIKPTKTSVLDLMDESMRLHPPGSILYLLTMSAPEGIAERIESLSDADVEVRWIIAPRELFPPYGGKDRKLSLKIPEGLHPQPLLCGQKTNLTSLLDYD